MGSSVHIVRERKSFVSFLCGGVHGVESGTKPEVGSEETTHDGFGVHTYHTHLFGCVAIMYTCAKGFGW